MICISPWFHVQKTAHGRWLEQCAFVSIGFDAETRITSAAHTKEMQISLLKGDNEACQMILHRNTSNTMHNQHCNASSFLEKKKKDPLPSTSSPMQWILVPAQKAIFFCSMLLWKQMHSFLQQKCSRCRKAILWNDFLTKISQFHSSVHVHM